MTMLRLPSGQFFDTDKIINTDESIRPFNHKDGGVIFQVFVNYPTEDGVAVAFFDADARALYAWLEANSVHIGEDGQEVVHNGLDNGKLSLLRELALKEPARMGEFCDATDDEQCEALTQLTHDGYIDRNNLEGSRIGIYNLTDMGRAAINGN